LNYVVSEDHVNVHAHTHTHTHVVMHSLTQCVLLLQRELTRKMEDHVNVHAHTHTRRYAFTNPMCSSLTERAHAKNQKRTQGPQSEAERNSGEFSVLSLPNTIHIAVLLNWHFHRKERNHFIVNIRLY